MHLSFSKSCRLKLRQLNKNQMESVNHLVCIFVMHKMIVMVIVINIVQEDGIDKIQGIDRLQTFVGHTFIGLCHVCFRSIEQDALLERFRPRHLHLYNELSLLVVLAAHVHNTVFLSFRPIGDFLCRPVFNALHPLVILQGQEGVEQTDNEVLVLAEYLLESQVGFRV